MEKNATLALHPKLGKGTEASLSLLAGAFDELVRASFARM